jgi:hypothetical protein
MFIENFGVGCVRVGGLLAALALSPPAWGQTTEMVGTRALGMGGAFVAVADDATAIYWNPAGLATGATFSLVGDVDSSKTRADERLPPAASRSGAFIGFGIPALGLGYYRLRTTQVQSSVEGEPVASSLITHHTAINVLNTVVDGLVVGASFKLVRGIAAQELGSLAMSTEGLLDEAEDLVGRAGTDFDADIGLMLNLYRARFGLLVRNAREAEFETRAGGRFRLERQVRAGVAVLPNDAFTLSLDADLRTAVIETGEWRSIAVGAEYWLANRRLGVRGGGRGSTIGEARPVGAFGASWAVRRGAFVDGQFTRGSDDAESGWGISVRFVY